MRNPIRLFVSDIDGCLSEPYKPYELRVLSEVAEMARAAGSNEAMPHLSLCSGRPYPYVEAMTQLLGLTFPVLFESGGGLFDPSKARVEWNPCFTEEIASQIEEIRGWMGREIIPDTSLMIDHCKRTQAGVIGPDYEEIVGALDRIVTYVDERMPGFRVFHTTVSIDVLPPDITKRQALDWLSEVTGTPVSQMAYIGDTNGDLEALQNVGYSFAPANADPAVRAHVQVVTNAPVSAGMLEAYRWCADYNRGGRPEPAPAGVSRNAGP
jgi:hydroxymethylpyrimidine pyrophosphatase-like HAD family hydrolase